MVKITEKFLNEGKSAKGGWNREQLAALGVDWPPPSGWKKEILGQLIDEKNAQTFLDAKK